ncbi:unnamed protein product [Symbiodinium sp. CCMP2592]|nr:unnamed protein product [Symbiodinium sp. CCMP2592]
MPTSPSPSAWLRSEPSRRGRRWMPTSLAPCWRKQVRTRWSRECLTKPGTASYFSTGPWLSGWLSRASSPRRPLRCSSRSRQVQKSGGDLQSSEFGLGRNASLVRPRPGRRSSEP